MSDNNQLIQSVSILADILTQSEITESAIARYELLSGSLVWSDEIPTHTVQNSDCLRYILNYRTGLIIGEPDGTFAPIWQEALRQFPNWIGFLPERIVYNSELAEFYHSERSRIFKQLGMEE